MDGGFEWNNYHLGTVGYMWMTHPQRTCIRLVAESRPPRDTPNVVRARRRTGIQRARTFGSSPGTELRAELRLDRLRPGPLTDRAVSVEDRLPRRVAVGPALGVEVQPVEVRAVHVERGDDVAPTLVLGLELRTPDHLGSMVAGVSFERALGSDRDLDVGMFVGVGPMTDRDLLLGALVILPEFSPATALVASASRRPAATSAIAPARSALRIRMTPPAFSAHTSIGR